eukprot:gene19460-biopygen6091
MSRGGVREWNRAGIEAAASIPARFRSRTPQRACLSVGPPLRVLHQRLVREIANTFPPHPDRTMVDELSDEMHAGTVDSDDLIGLRREIHWGHRVDENGDRGVAAQFISRPLQSKRCILTTLVCLGALWQASEMVPFRGLFLRPAREHHDAMGCYVWDDGCYVWDDGCHGCYGCHGCCCESTMTLNHRTQGDKPNIGREHPPRDMRSSETAHCLPMDLGVHTTSLVTPGMLKILMLNLVEIGWSLSAQAGVRPRM